MNHLPNDEPLLLRDDRDGVATLTLNRPKAFNTLSPVKTATRTVLMEVPVPGTVMARGSGESGCWCCSSCSCTQQ